MAVRLTKRDEDGDLLLLEEERLFSSRLFIEIEDINNIKMHLAEKLVEYEDLEEQGLLVKLPCKVGDTVYTNTSMQGWYFRKENRPYEAKIVFIGINGADNFMNVDFGNGRMLQFNFSDIGKIVFLTHNQAEQSLKEMEDDKDD